MELGSKRLLCVDDDLATLKVRKFLLEAAGYAVITASSGAEAPPSPFRVISTTREQGRAFKLLITRHRICS